MHIHLKIGLVAVAAIAVLAMGCGSSDDSQSATDSVGGSTASGEGAGMPRQEIATSSLSRDEFVKQANRACSQARAGSLEEVAAYEKSHRSEGLPQAVLSENAIKTVTLSITETEIDALRRLGAPEGDEEEIKAIITALEKSSSEAKNPAVGYREVSDKFADVNKKLQAYGLARCTK